MTRRPPSGQPGASGPRRSVATGTKHADAKEDGRTASSSLNLLFRRYLSGHPDPFRSVRDLGRLSVRCSRESGFPRRRSSGWLPAWLPGKRDSRLRRPPLRSSEFVPSACPDSIAHPWEVRNHSAYIPDHGNCPRDRPHRAGDGPRPGPGRLPPGPWFLTGVSAEVSSVKRDFACTLARHLPLMLVTRRSQSRLMLEGRARKLSGLSPGPEPSQNASAFRPHADSPPHSGTVAVTSSWRRLAHRSPGTAG